jgi:hypothetical protein
MQNGVLIILIWVHGSGFKKIRLDQKSIGYNIYITNRPMDTKFSPDPLLNREKNPPNHKSWIPIAISRYRNRWLVVKRKERDGTGTSGSELFFPRQIKCCWCWVAAVD